jgi:hypothetical protein
VAQKPAQPPPQPIVAHSGEIRKLTRPGINHYEAEVGMTAPGEVELEQFWFPGWVAMVDGRDTRVFPSGPQAVTACHVPAGDHRVEFRYTGMPQRRNGLAISAVFGLLATLSIFGAGRWFLERKGGAA